MMKLRQRYEREFLRNDGILAMAAAAALLAYGYHCNPPLAEATKGNLYSVLATFAGSTVGFLISATAIVLAFGDMPQLGLLRRSGQYRIAIKVYFSAMKWLAALFVVAALGLLVDSGTKVRVWPFGLCIGLIPIAFFRLTRCLWVLRNLATIAINFQEASDAERTRDTSPAPPSQQRSA